MKTFDVDGTLLNFDAVKGSNPVANLPLIASIKPGERIALVTNQGGLPFGLMDEAGTGKYPRPVDFVWRLTWLVNLLTEAGIEIGGVYVCTYHPKAPVGKCEEAAADILRFLESDTGLLHVYHSEEWRKPHPDMLVAAGATVYYSDGSEDAQAAASAGIPFGRVERFTSGAGGRVLNAVPCSTCGQEQALLVADDERWCAGCGRAWLIYCMAAEVQPEPDDPGWRLLVTEYDPNEDDEFLADKAREFVEEGDEIFPQQTVTVWVKQGKYGEVRCFDVFAEKVVTYFAVLRDECILHDRPLPCPVCLEHKLPGEKVGVISQAN